MYTLEKNDIDISKLFTWSDRFELIAPNKTVLDIIYLRIVGDAEMNRARIMALRKASELRKKLLNTDSDERVAYIADYDSLGRDKVMAYITYANSKNIYKEVATDIQVTVPKEPRSDAPQAEQEAHQAEIDAYPDKMRQAIQNEVDKRLEKIIAIIGSKTNEELYAIYVENLINDLCEAEMYDRFVDYCTYFGAYKDEALTEKYFPTQEEFENIPSYIKRQIREFYTSLEVDTATLKK
jgi:L-rhamnose isomerase